MPRYIDADRLRNRVKAETNPYGKPTLEYASGLKVLTMIDKEPTADVVEVVRCKDCALRGRPECAMFYACNCGEQHTCETDNDFCSYGIRKETK